MTITARNIYTNGKRTSVRIEPQIWYGLNDICNSLRIKSYDLINQLYTRTGKNDNFSSNIRVYVCEFYRHRYNGLLRTDAHKKALRSVKG